MNTFDGEYGYARKIKPTEENKNIFERSLDNLADITKNIVDKGLEKIDKLNDLSNTVIDKQAQFVGKTTDQVSNVLGNVASFTNILNSENLIYYVVGIGIFHLLLKKL